MERKLNVGLEKVTDVQDVFIKVGVNNKKKANARLVANGTIGPEHMAADKWIRGGIDKASVMTPSMRSQVVGRLIATKFLPPTPDRTKVSREEICAALDKVIKIGKKS